MIACVVGCGNWGSRVAQKLAQTEGVLLSAVFDADRERQRVTAELCGPGTSGDLESFVGFLQVMQPHLIVLALPPGHRDEYIDTILNCGAWEGGLMPHLRIEKPLALCVEDAKEIASRCEHAGVKLSVGFTLLHHPAYDSLSEMVGLCGAESLVARRVGRSPAHDTDACLDLGIHAAAVAAYNGIDDAVIDAEYSGDTNHRYTVVITGDGVTILVDELSPEYRRHDPLQRELDALVRGEHRGTPEIAIRAQELVEKIRPNSLVESLAS